MGGKLSQANMDTKTQSGHNDEFKYASMSVQGWQYQMQNTSLSCLNIDSNSKNGNSLFAVFDGVRGNFLSIKGFEVSHFLKQTFVSVLVNSEAYVQGNYQEALKYTFQKIDQLIFSEKGQRRLQQIRTQNNGEVLVTNEHISDSTGSLASVVLLTKKKIYAAHIGDSKIYLLRDKSPLVLCQNHKADSFDQKLRVQKAGSQISQGRINGNLNISRAFGFGKFKQNNTLQWDQQIVSCSPQIKVIERTISDQFLFMACDGVWGGYEKKQANLLKKIKQICEQNGDKIDECLREVIKMSIAKTPDEENDVGAKNMTAILVKFNQI